MPKQARKAKVLPLEKPGKRAASQSSEDDICTAVFNAVMEHRLPPGTKLTESAFSGFFGVGRTVIRNALFKLAQRNVVELRPNKGAVVASPTIEETHAVFDARRIVEREIIQTVANNISKEQLKQLKTLAGKEQKAQKDNDRHTLVRLSGDLHIQLAKIAGNEVITPFLTELVSRTSLIIALYEAPGAPACATHDHWELIDLIEKKQSEDAAEAMLAHLNEVEGRLNLTQTQDNIDLNEIFKALA